MDKIKDLVKDRGWKTLLGGVVSIGAAVFGVYSGEVSWQEAARYLSEGLIAIGIGHKLDKVKNSNVHKNIEDIIGGIVSGVTANGMHEGNTGATKPL